LFGFTIRLDGVILARLGFQEGGRITTKGAVAFLMVSFLGLFFRAPGFMGVDFVD
jgi:hypothetical protein